MSIKYTDLEVFSRKNIINPYRNMMFLGWCGHSHECRCDNADMSLKEITNYIKQNKESEWWKCVLNRLKGMQKGQGFYFPNYIKHELLEILQEEKILNNYLK